MLGMLLCVTLFDISRSERLWFNPSVHVVKWCVVSWAVPILVEPVPLQAATSPSAWIPGKQFPGLHHGGGGVGLCGRGSSARYLSLLFVLREDLADLSTAGCGARREAHLTDLGAVAWAILARGKVA